MLFQEQCSISAVLLFLNRDFTENLYLTLHTTVISHFPSEEFSRKFTHISSKACTIQGVSEMSVGQYRALYLKYEEHSGVYDSLHFPENSYLTLSKLSLQTVHIWL